MSNFTPIFYLKEKCPFCLKVRIALLETGLADKVEIREFAPGTEAETEIRSELSPHLEKVSFPAAQIEPGNYIADSDAIIAQLQKIAKLDSAALPVLNAYVTGPFNGLMELYRENMELKARAT